MRPIGWKKICCPVDFSDESRAALRVAMDLARRFDAELTLLHVAEAGDGTSEPLAAWREGVAQDGVRAAIAETSGNPQAAIAEYATANGFDAIVMGTHGRTGRAHALVGSVAESTVRSAHCPVMVVHGEWSGVQ